MHLSPLIHAHGGIARGSELSEFGCTRKQLSIAVRNGEIRRLRPGVFATWTADEDAVTAAAHGGALTCSTALRLHSVWVLDTDEHPHVWLGAGGRRFAHTPCTCIQHFRTGPMKLGVAPVEHSLVHAFACHGEEFFFAAFESAWNRRLIVGRVDFVIEDRIILEADGKVNHASSTQRHRDLSRDAVASRLGYETLRFDYALIIHEWDTVIAAITAALARARA